MIAVEFLLPAVPLLLLVSSLLCGLYPGHRVAMRLVERISPRAGRGARTAQRPRRPWAPEFGAVRGGLLIAFGLAQRPPPLAP